MSPLFGFTGWFGEKDFYSPQSIEYITNVILGSPLRGQPEAVLRCACASVSPSVGRALRKTTVSEE